MEETTAMKKQRLTTTTETQPSPSTGVTQRIILPLDIIEEILCRLSVKTLIKFQCVCKYWKSLISDNPNFAKKQVQKSLTCHRQSRHHLIIKDKTDKEKYLDSPISSVFDDKIMQTKLSFPPILKAGYYEVVGNCHGILCFEIPLFVVYWNPTIRKYKISPILEFGCEFSYGFGYDYINHNYKMVAISLNSKKPKVIIHTLGTNYWRTIQEFPFGVVPVHNIRVGESGKFVGGAVNWVASKGGKQYNTLFSVVSFDLGNESYQEILQPDYGELKVVSLTLDELKDCLCIFAHGHLIVDVWLMKEYGKKESWIKLFTIPHIEDLGSYPSVILDDPRALHALRLVNFDRYNLYVKCNPCIKITYIFEDEQVLLLSRDKKKPKFVVYDSRSDAFKIPKIENLNISRMYPTVYVESLITSF